MFPRFLRSRSPSTGSWATFHHFCMLAYWARLPTHNIWLVQNVQRWQITRWTSRTIIQIKWWEILTQYYFGRCFWLYMHAKHDWYLTQWMLRFVKQCLLSGLSGQDVAHDHQSIRQISCKVRQNKKVAQQKKVTLLTLVLVHYEFLPPVRTINKECYCSIFYFCLD